MYKVLIICGPTAVGKTDLALFLAKKFKTDILVADSRQVFRGMDVITGKDIPEGSKYFKKEGYWETPKNVKIWLTDIIDPNEEMSVSVWHKKSIKLINSLHKQNKLPIVVGGTGLYIKSLLSNIESIDIPPNKNLRRTLIGKSTDDLYEILAKVDGLRAGNMNNSDKKNPRRLVRAIEVGLDRGKINKAPVSKFDVLQIGLTTDKLTLHSRITQRVEDRLKNGAIKEIKNLLITGISWESQAFDTLGYKQLGKYLRGEETLKVAIENWKTEECQYANRQATWFKKDKNIKWYDISNVNWDKEVEKEVRNWYNSNIKD